MFLFGSGSLIATQTQNQAGVATPNATPVKFGTLQDVSGDISFEKKELYGGYQFPVAVARGKGKMEFKAKFASLNASIIGDLLLGTGSEAGIKDVINDFAATIPSGTPFTITVAPPNTGTFESDLGVVYAVSGSPLTKVASAPVAGEYAVSAGVYTFASADADQDVLISYGYTATGSSRVVQISNQLMGTAPTFSVALDISLNGKNATLMLNRCTSNKLSLPFKNDDFTVPEFDFSAMADDAGNIGYIALSE